MQSYTTLQQMSCRIAGDDGTPDARPIANSPLPDNAFAVGIAREIWTAQPFVPERPSLARLRSAAAGCTGCPLWRTATQTVFGEGPAQAKAMFVGEQPGHDEDLAGLPFVGPAGKLLDRCLAEAGIDRAAIYVTNAVKHFKWAPGGREGKRRLHKKPGSREIAACRPWLEAELDLLQPSVIVALGATAAQTLLGRDFRLTRHRGQFIPSPLAPHLLATVHPSSLLRAPDPQTRQKETARFIEDLRLVREFL